MSETPYCLGHAIYLEKTIVFSLYWQGPPSAGSFFFFPSYMSHPSVACGAVGSKLNFLPCYYSLILLQCCHLVYLHSSCRSVASLGMFLAVYLSCCSFVWTHISLNVGDVDHFTKGICQRWSVWEIKRIISQTGSFGLCPRGGTLELLFIYAHFYFPSSL